MENYMIGHKNTHVFCKNKLWSLKKRVFCMENYMICHKNTRVFLQEQNTRVFLREQNTRVFFARKNTHVFCKNKLWSQKNAYFAWKTI